MIEYGILLVLLAFSAFFSGVETALMSMNSAKVNAALKQKLRGAEALHRLKQDPSRLITLILIVNNLVNISAASFATVIFTDLFGSKGVGIATGVMTFLILVFGEITPKTFAAQNAKAFSLIAARPLELLSYVLKPFISFFAMISNLMLRVIGSKGEAHLSEEEIRSIVTLGMREGILSREAANLMHNVMAFENIKVSDIMTSAEYMVSLQANKKLSAALPTIIKSRFSRFPVFGRKKIVGILEVDDILKYVKSKRLSVLVRKMVRKPLFVSKNKKISELLTHFETKNDHMAIVRNRSKVVGLVTVEDILEEIVGDIFDKSQRSSVYLKRVNPKLIRADARVSIEKINQVLHLGLKAEHFETLAGFIKHKFKKLPKKGEKIKLNNVTLIVDKVTKKGIKSVKIIKL